MKREEGHITGNKSPLSPVVTRTICVLQAERLQQLAHVRHEEEGRIAAVLEQQQHDAERGEKELQRLRNESSELRELQEQIKTAKVGTAGDLSIKTVAGCKDVMGKGL